MTTRMRNTSLPASLLAAVSALVIFAVELPAQLQVPQDFTRSLEEHGMILDQAPLNDYRLVPVSSNPDMEFDLALRSPSVDLEIRYAIREGIQSWEELAFATLLNVGRADPASAELARFDVNAVREEFNADAGVSGAFEPRETFAGEWDLGLMVAIWSEGRGMAYIFYLYNREQVMPALSEIGEVFHAVRFR